MLKKKLSGVIPPHLKNTANFESEIMLPPKLVTIPLSMHIGAPAVCVVKPGDRVLVGQLIAESNGAVSAPVHASVSGTVTKITEYLAPNGRTCPAVVIESDGEMQVSPDVKPPIVTDRDSFIKAVRESGCVGLGGAGFPTSVKLSANGASIDEIIVNGAECEPYITSDTRTMAERSELIELGCELLTKYLNVEKIYIAVEKSNREAIKSMRRTAERLSSTELKVLPSMYPQGGEKVLIYNVTGKKVPFGKLPADVGTVVINCTTLAVIAEYVKTGIPLVSKCVTVDGSAVKTPKNVVVPIGTSVGDVFDFCGGFAEAPEKVLYGGLMMGICVPSLDMPVLKNTNAILALGKKEATAPPQTACLRCGKCVSACPLGLNPPAIASALDAGNADALETLCVKLCMECGSCAFICPAGRPIVQNNKLAKLFLTEHKPERKGETKQNA